MTRLRRYYLWLAENVNRAAQVRIYSEAERDPQTLAVLVPMSHIPVDVGEDTVAAPWCWNVHVSFYFRISDDAGPYTSASQN